jgi:hypothetical protein
MSLLIVLQLLIASLLGPIAFCLCSDDCLPIGTEAVDCCPPDECCPPDREAVRVAVSDSCCDWCITISGGDVPKLFRDSDDRQQRAATGIADRPACSRLRTLDQLCSDRWMMATGPPLAIAHLRTVRLLV